MLSRILWISVAGVALIAGMVVQGGSIFGWDDTVHMSSKSDGSFDSKIDQVIDRSFDGMQVIGADGREVDVPAETKREMAGAVSRLVKAEADLAMLRIGDGSAAELKAAQDRALDARADIERTKAKIDGAERAASAEHDALRAQIQKEVREDVRAAVRDAARN